MDTAFSALLVVLAYFYDYCSETLSLARFKMERIARGGTFRWDLEL